MTSRRNLLIAAGAALVAPSMARADERFPSLLDHVIVGCNDLDAGIQFLRERIGVGAAPGGVHPDRGTANALLSLGDRHYLEIMAPNPDAKDVQPWAARQVETLKTLASPRLVGWAVHCDDLERLAQKFQQSGVRILGPWPGSRKQPDGSIVSWRNFSLADDRHGLFPFFIEWGKDSAHPSSNAPGGTHIERFALASPDTEELSQALRGIEVEAPVEYGQVARLQLRIVGPGGKLEITS